MSLVDLGKRLLEAARKGQDDEVRNLMANGAPFTTDWVSPSHTYTRNTHTHRVSRVRVVLVTCPVTRQSHDAVAEPDVMESLKSGS